MPPSSKTSNKNRQRARPRTRRTACPLHRRKREGEQLETVCGQRTTPNGWRTSFTLRLNLQRPLLFTTVTNHLQTEYSVIPNIKTEAHAAMLVAVMAPQDRGLRVFRDSFRWNDGKVQHGACTVDRDPGREGRCELPGNRLYAT